MARLAQGYTGPAKGSQVLGKKKNRPIFRPNPTAGAKSHGPLGVLPLIKIFTVDKIMYAKRFD